MEREIPTPAPPASALVTRMVSILQRPSSDRLAVVLGSGATRSVVPGVGQIIEAALHEMDQARRQGRLSAEHLELVNSALASAPTDAHKYAVVAEQVESLDLFAFDTLIQKLILAAYRGHLTGSLSDDLDPASMNELCRRAEEDHHNWRVPQGVQALADIVASIPPNQRPTLVTTNFDPLLEVALRIANNAAVAVDASSDAPIETTLSTSGSEVYHVHGYWRNGHANALRQMLHLGRDLQIGRPTLAASLADAFRDGSVLFVGYGGWEDVFTQVLRSVNTQKRLQILWAQYAEDDSAALSLTRQISSLTSAPPNSIKVYKGVDADRLFTDVRRRVLGQPVAPPIRRRPKFTPLARATDRKAYGSKAATLAQMLSQNLQVPNGFALSLGDTAEKMNEQQLKKLSEVWEAMESQKDVRSWIVRSSAAVEDNPGAVFPGRFTSVGGVRDFETLKKAVAACLASGASSRVSEYVDAVKADHANQHMALIIQEEVECECSGVAFYPPPAPFDDPDSDVVVEMTLGTASDLLNGEGGTLYQNFSDQRRYKRIAGPELPGRLVHEVMSALTPVMRQIEAVLQGARRRGQRDLLLDVEWAWDGLVLHVLQARYIEEGPPIRSAPQAPAHKASDRPALLLPGAAEWGSKAAAAQLFDELGIGARNTTIIPPGTPERDIASQLQERAQGRNGTVIRFSVGSEVGVPKRFVAYRGNVFDAFMEAMDEIADSKIATGIISDFVFVGSSFEAYLSEDSLMVEHVPANWEADSTLSPDLFMWTPGRFDYFRVRTPRECIVELPSEDGLASARVEVRPPLEDSVAESWAGQIVAHFERIAAKLYGQLPLNVHFIADEDGEWRFLNIRPTQPIVEWGNAVVADGRFKPNRFYLVNSVEDVAGWDEASRILVTAAPERRKVDTIARVGVNLQSRGVTTVYCSFGILSHPAIVLRELGIEVRPLYGDHERRAIAAPLWAPGVD